MYYHSTTVGHVMVLCRVFTCSFIFREHSDCLLREIFGQGLQFCYLKELFSFILCCKFNFGIGLSDSLTV